MSPEPCAGRSSSHKPGRGALREVGIVRTVTFTTIIPTLQTTLPGPKAHPGAPQVEVPPFLGVGRTSASRGFVARQSHYFMPTRLLRSDSRDVKAGSGPFPPTVLAVSPAVMDSESERRIFPFLQTQKALSRPTGTSRRRFSCHNPTRRQFRLPLLWPPASPGGWPSFCRVQSGAYRRETLSAKMG
jgi:hypothetical protein